MVCEPPDLQEHTCGRPCPSALQAPGVSTPSHLSPHPTGAGCTPQACWCSLHSSGHHLCCGLYLDSLYPPSCLVLPAAALQHHSPGRLITEVFLDCLSRKTALCLSLSPLSLLLHLHLSKSEMPVVVVLWVWHITGTESVFFKKKFFLYRLISGGPGS